MPERIIVKYIWSAEDSRILMYLVVVHGKRSLKLSIFDQVILEKIREKLKELPRGGEYVNYVEEPRWNGRFGVFLVSCEYDSNPNWDMDFKKIFDDLLGFEGIRYNN